MTSSHLYSEIAPKAYLQIVFVKVITWNNSCYFPFGKFRLFPLENWSLNYFQVGKKKTVILIRYKSLKDQEPKKKKKFFSPSVTGTEFQKHAFAEDVHV